MATQYTIASTLADQDHNHMPGIQGTGIDRRYELIMIGCKQQNKSQVYQVLMDLINGLDFNHQTRAREQFKAYEMCIRFARANQFNDITKVISRLQNPGTQLVPHPQTMVAI